MGKTVKPIKDISREIRFLEHVKIYEPRINTYWVIARAGGFRCSDVIELKVEDIKRVLKQGYFDFNERKTQKQRKTYIEREVKQELLEIIEGMQDYEYIIQSGKGVNQPLTQRQMQRLIVKYGARCGIKDIGTHTPRKTSGYHIYIETGDIDEVKDFLDHDNLRDTYAYIDVPDERRKQQAIYTNNPYKKLRKTG